MTMVVPRLSNRAAMLVIAVVTCIAVGNGITAPFLNDDMPKIVQNPDIKSIGNLCSRIVYPYSETYTFARNDPSRPLPYVVYTVVHHFFGLRPAAYHFVGALIHFLNALLVFYLFRRIARRLYGGDDVSAALVVALLFVTSPINVGGAAVYAFALGYLLAALLQLSSLLAYDDYLSSGRRGVYAVSLVAYALSFLCNQSVIVFPAILLAYVHFVAEKDGTRPSLWRTILPYVGVAALYVVWRLSYFGVLGDVEASKRLWSPLQYLATAPLAIVTYVRLLLLPYGYSIDHNTRLVDDLPSVLIPGTLIILAGCAALLPFRNRSPLRLLCGFAVLWFLLALAPATSVLPTAEPVAERRAYFPSPALYGLIVFAVYDRARRAVAEGRGSVADVRRWLVAFSAGAVALFLVVSVYRNHVRADVMNVWSHVLRMYPDHPRARMNVAGEYYRLGEEEPAAALYEAVLLVAPDWPDALLNLGSIYLTEAPPRDAGKARGYFERLVRVKPGSASAWLFLGVAEYQEGDEVRGLESVRKALQLEPDVPQGKMILAMMGSREEIYLRRTSDYGGQFRSLRLVAKEAVRFPLESEKAAINFSMHVEDFVAALRSMDEFAGEGAVRQHWLPGARRLGSEIIDAWEAGAKVARQEAGTMRSQVAAQGGNFWVVEWHPESEPSLKCFLAFTRDGQLLMKRGDLALPEGQYCLSLRAG